VSLLGLGDVALTPSMSFLILHPTGLTDIATFGRCPELWHFAQARIVHVVEGEAVGRAEPYLRAWPLSIRSEIVAGAERAQN